MNSDDTYSLESTDGPIRGNIVKTNEGTTFYTFKKIPFAKPPLGPLRFRPPVPATPWKEELDCTQDASLPFHVFEDKNLIGSEDCLYIEVSTKNLNPDKPVPVMFWIGSYVFSNTIDSILDPTLLVNQDVIFVRCGFRLGPFGFLSINEFTAPGNCGLKDIVMALKWVQRNIEKFGGDPNNVTIFGSSSGGSAVHLLMLSTMAAGLFHKAIIQSASAFNNWSLDKNPSQTVMELAEYLGIKSTHKIEVVEKLRSIPAEDIMKSFLELQNILYQRTENLFDGMFKPCIEEDFEGLPTFLTKSPLSIIKSRNFNKVPLLIGSNNIEAAVIQHVVKDFYADFQKYNDNASLVVPKSLSRHDLKTSNVIGHSLMQFYLGKDAKFTENTKTEYIHMMSDYHFLYYVNKTVRLHSEFAPEYPIYYYIVNCAGEWYMPDEFSFLNSLGHSTELPFIFQIKKLNESSQTYDGSRESVTTRSRVIRMWTNFAKYSNPTPDEDDPLLNVTWDPVENKDKLNYLSIGSELTKGRNPFNDRMLFWDGLHKEYSILRMLVYFNDIGVSW